MNGDSLIDFLGCSLLKIIIQGWVALFATQHYDASECWVNEKLLTQPTRFRVAPLIFTLVFRTTSHFQ